MYVPSRIARHKHKKDLQNARPVLHFHVQVDRGSRIDSERMMRMSRAADGRNYSFFSHLHEVTRRAAAAEIIGSGPFSG